MGSGAEVVSLYASAADMISQLYKGCLAAWGVWLRGLAKMISKHANIDTEGGDVKPMHPVTEVTPQRRQSMD